MLDNNLNLNRFENCEKEVIASDEASDKQVGQIFGTSQPKKDENQSHKVEWVALSLTLLSIIIGWVQFNIQNNQSRQSIIKEYIDNISALKFDRNLNSNNTKVDERRREIFGEVTNKSNSVEKRLLILAAIDKDDDKNEATTNAKLIARAQTLAALRRLDDDGESKGFIILFLYEAGLIKSYNPKREDSCKRSEPDSIISLDRGDLRKVNLEDKSLCSINLRGAILQEAKLKNVILKEANLYKTDLTSADLRNADLRNADLRNADLREANLTNANLSGACYNNKTKFDSNLALKMRQTMRQKCDK